MLIGKYQTTLNLSQLSSKNFIQNSRNASTLYPLRMNSFKKRATEGLLKLSEDGVITYNKL